MKLKDCDNCLVYGSDRKPLVKARVLMLGDNVFQLHFGAYKLKNAKFRTIVDFYDGQQGLVRCQCDLVVKQRQAQLGLDGEWIAEGTIAKVNDVVQRQKDLRVKVHMSLEFVADDGTYTSGIVQNISAGGLYLVTSYRMVPGQYFTFAYTFENEQRRITAKVLRVKRLAAESSYGYGCKFLELSPDAEADVRKFVYRKQIEKQLKRKERIGE